MVTMTASINAGDVARFNSALAEYASSLGEDISTAPRRAAIQIRKSLRAGTKSAPKRARTSEYMVSKSGAKPKHVTSKTHGDLRRWTLNRSAVGRGVYDVYEAKRSDVRKNKLVLFHQGLAKQSWGWVMHNIYNGESSDAPWKRRKNDRRNPKDATRESMSNATNGIMQSSGIARISNRLDYIGDTLKISLDQAITKAINWMLKQIELRRPKV